jgi:uncharacterized protein YutE (UPF0331/DUF86 family)
MNFIPFPISSVEARQSESNRLQNYLADNPKKNQVCLKKILSVRNLLVSSIYLTDSELLKEELQKILEMIYEISREI